METEKIKLPAAGEYNSKPIRIRQVFFHSGRVDIWEEEKKGNVKIIEEAEVEEWKK